MRLLLLLALLATTPAAGQEGWPTAETPRLEVRAGDVAVFFPAPDWVHNREPKIYDGPEGSGSWSLGAGFDRETHRLEIRIEPQDSYRSYAQAFMYRLRDDCDGAYSPRLTLYGGGAYHSLLCAVPGYIAYSMARPTPGKIVVDIRYQAKVDRFDFHDEATWPMTREALDAWAAELSSLIEVTVAGEPLAQ